MSLLEMLIEVEYPGHYQFLWESGVFRVIRERDRQMLEDLGPLVPNMKDILGDEVLDLLDIRGVKGRHYSLNF